jgi:hypothetical protein
MEHLTEYGVSLLAVYNAETHRGIMHTPEWKERMAKLQAQYDEKLREHLRSKDA